MVSTSTNFDSGGAVDITVDDPNNEIDLTHDDPNGYGHPCFFFRVDDAVGESVDFTITDLGSKRMPADYHLLYSDNPDPYGWERFSGTAGGGWTHTFQNDGVYVGAAHMYPYGAIVDRVNELDDHPLVETEVIGQSGEGRDMHAIRIPNPDVDHSQTEDVVALTRQHPGETQGSFNMDAAIDFILGVYAGNGSFDADYTFHFIPAMNPDGIYNGSHRFTGDGTDLNREWDTSTPVEIDNAQTYITNNTGTIHWGIDYHSSTNPTFAASEYYAPAMGATEEAMIERIASYNYSFDTPDGTSNTNLSYSYFGVDHSAPGIITECWTYYEYTEQQMRDEGIGTMQTITGVPNVVTHDGNLVESGGNIVTY